MRNGVRTRTTLLAMIATGLMIVLGGTAAASDTQSGPGGGRGGEVHGHGAALVNTFDFDVYQDSSDVHDARGYFKAAGSPPPGDEIVAPQGPATCVYPLVEPSKPEVLVGTGILISVKDGRSTGPDLIEFTGPLPLAAFGDQCAPTLAGAVQPVTSGDISVDPRD